MVRFKNRYLLIELVWADNKHDPSLSSYILVQALKELIRAEFGEYGLACALQSLQGKIFCCIRTHHTINRQYNLYSQIFKQRHKSLHPAGSARVPQAHLDLCNNDEATSK